MLLAVNVSWCYPVSQGSVLCEWGAGALGIWVGSESVTTFRTASKSGVCYCAWNSEETAMNTAFLLLHAGRSADKIGTRLEGNGKETSTLVHADIWELPSSGHNWAFSHLSPPWSLLAWEPEFLGPKSSLTYLQLRWVMKPGVQFPISWMRETGLAPEHLFQTQAQCQSVDKWLRGGCGWGSWGCLWWAGGCNCLVRFIGPGLRIGDGRLLGTQLLWHWGP